MATINTAWSIAVGTLQADQSALNVVSNNISNANTTGYTRELPTWEENSTFQANGITYGQGSSVTGIVAQRDSVLEKRLNQQTSDANEASSRLAALNNVQSIFTVSTSTGSSNSSTSTGDLSTSISSFFNSLSSLESSPNSSSLRESVLSAANSLAQNFQSVASNLAQERTSVDAQASSLVSQVNALTASIAKLNTQIANSGGSDTNSLQDERQNDLNQLSQLVGINEIQGNHGTITVTTTSGDLLVNEGTSSNITPSLGSSTSALGSVTLFSVNGKDVTSDLTSGGGQMGGLLTVRDQDIPKYQSKLDDLAYGISTAINSANNAGWTTSGTPGTGATINAADYTTVPVPTKVDLSIFSSPSSSTSHAGYAASMSVVMTNTANIAVSTTDPTDTATGSDGGNYNNLTSMANIANSAVVGTDTATNYYSQFVSDLGSLVKEVGIDNTAQQASLTQLQGQRDSLSAVNLDEEAASLSTYEKAYQSASKLFAILNTIMSSAINLGTQTSV